MRSPHSFAIAADRRSVILGHMPDGVLIYYNPACSKSRAAAAILDERGAAYVKRDYVAQPLDAQEIGQLLDQLPGEEHAAVLRRKDPRFAELGLGEGVGAGEPLPRERIVAALVLHPELLERPIVVRGHRAIIARPPERLLELW